jgi:hypothetical protein
MAVAVRSRILVLLAASLAWPSVGRALEIRCNSENYRYRFCGVDVPVRDAQVVRKISVLSSCDFGRDWGYQRNGVWVHHGCQAVFALNPRSDGGGWGGGHGGGGWDGEGGWGGHGGPGWVVPGWAIGRWESHDRWQGRTVLLTVYPGGAVLWQADGWNRGMRGRWLGRDSILLDDGTRIDVDRQGFDSERIRLEWRRGERMYFRRIG